MKKLLATLLALMAVVAVHAADRPNILLILADDLGWSDLGCYGGEIRTPNLDALAKGGLRFTQFYNSARCCPTRASLLTGLYPHQAGVGSMTSDRGPEHPGYRGTLQPNTATLAEVLRDAGYKTYMAGKWHLHNNKTDVKPIDRGFDEFYGMLGGFNSCWQEKPFYTRWPEGRTPRAYTSANNGQPGTFYATDAFADYALDFIGEARRESKPFFLYLAFNAPHFPLHAHDSDIAKYEAMYFAKGWDIIREERLARQKELGLVPKNLALTPRSSVPPKSHAKSSPYAGNTPWRLYKHFSHEGGIRTPLIVHWPAGVEARGEFRAQPGHVIDVMPTLIAVAGAAYPAERNGVAIQPMEGRSLLPAFENQPVTRTEPLFFEHEGSRAVRDGKWKLVSLSGDAWELYDLEADPTEMNNLLARQPAKARDLVTMWHAWAKRCHVEIISNEAVVR